MSPALPAAGEEKENSLCPHTWDKSRCFCDTTQIDVKNVRSLTRTIIRAPVDNGWDARRSLLGLRAVRSALRSPFAGRSPPRFHHRGLSAGLPRRVLLSVTGLICLVVVAYYTQILAICQPPSPKNFYRVKAANPRPPPRREAGAPHLPLIFHFFREPE